MKSKKTTPINAGLILSVILIAFSVGMYVLVNDMKVQQKFSWVSYILIIGGILFTCVNHANEMNGNVSFGNIFGYGFKVSAVLTSIMLIFTILSFTVLFPEMKGKIMDVAREQMETNPQLNPDQIDQAMSMTEKFFMPFAIGGVIVGYLIMGAIGSLLGAVIAKKNPNPTPFEQETELL